MQSIFYFSTVMEESGTGSFDGGDGSFAGDPVEDVSDFGDGDDPCGLALHEQPLYFTRHFIVVTNAWKT